MAAISADIRAENSDILIGMNARLEKATGQVSFWGSRIITEITEEGNSSSNLSSYVKHLNHQFNEVLLAGGKRADLTLEGRVAGLSVLRQIERLTKESDDYAAKAGFFTRICAFVGRVLFGNPQITFNVNNPFNEAKTRLEEIREKLDLPDEEYSNEQALQDLAYLRPSVLDHAVWIALGAPMSPVGGRIGGEEVDKNPKSEFVKKAIDDRILAFDTVDACNRAGFEANLSPAVFA